MTLKETILHELETADEKLLQAIVQLMRYNDQPALETASLETAPPQISTAASPSSERSLAQYFTFLADDDIRIQGTRIGIEHILYEYIHNAKTAEAITDLFPTVTLEQVYATILYYLQNKTIIGQYVSDWLDYTLKAEAEQDNNPDPTIQRLKALKATRTTAA